MKQIYCLLWLGLGWSLSLTAQIDAVSDVLRQIESNNKSIKVLRLNAASQKAQLDIQNMPEAPAVEYSPFFLSGVHGTASSELVVSQELDFPTLYIGRHRASRVKKEALDNRFSEERCAIMLEAKNLCLELIRLNKEQDILSARMTNSDTLLALFEKRFGNGDANALEVNKIKLERMQVQASVLSNQAAHRTALQKLLAMNANKPLDFSEKEYPPLVEIKDFSVLYDEVMMYDYSVRTATTLERAATMDANISTWNWLPKLQVGYRRNTASGEKSHGFLIGGSLPLFTGNKMSKLAKIQAKTAQLELDNIRLSLENRLQSQFNEMQLLKKTMRSFDLALMHDTLQKLMAAVTSGQISLLDYYKEAENVYAAMQEYINLEYKYQVLMASVYINRL